MTDSHMRLSLKTRLYPHRLAPAGMALSPAAEVPVRIVQRFRDGVIGGSARQFWDGLLFGFSASLMLWQDLPTIEVIVVLVVLFGAALAALRGSE